MKRKTMIMTAAMLFMLGGAVVLNGQEAQAAKKQKVKAVVKGSTLTVSGKGAMPAGLTVKKSKRNKIKKIVVKKGITSIPVNAFSRYKNVTSATVAASVKTIGAGAFRCEKLKKLTIPGDFKTKMNASSNGAYWVTGKVNTVVFNTDLNIERVAAFDANNLMVRKKDPKYKSINGIVYSKDGKEIVRVPFQRGTVQIAEGCEVFCLQSVMYANKDKGENSKGGCRVRKIVVPASVKKIESENYFALDARGLSGRVAGDEILGLQIELQTSQLDDQSFSELLYVLHMGINDLMKQYPERITLSGGMYIADNHVILKYKGEEHEVTVPEGITKIGDYAFYNNEKIMKLVLPEGLTEIGKKSFSGALRYVTDRSDSGKASGTEVTFPSTLKKIGEEAFSDNYLLRKVELPASLQTCGKGAFRSAGMEELILPDAMKVIPEAIARDNSLKKIVLSDAVETVEKQAFAYNQIEKIQFGINVKEIGEEAFCNHKVYQLTIPDTITKVGEDAFWSLGVSNVVIQGTSEGFADRIFSPYDTLFYAKGPKEQKTTFSFACVMHHYRKELELDMVWVPVRGAEGYEIVAATNTKFTKNKTKITVKKDVQEEVLTVKGSNFGRKSKAYVKIRPYSYMDGKKIYGRWSKRVAK